MYTIQENVRIVIAMLKQYGIHHIVISPGGTNIPISQAVQDDTFFHCYSVPDERSAMYFAIGLYLQTGEVIATSCTSAQATRNYIPGLTEAFYKHVPVLAITTAKLERFQYQDYMQAPDQCSLPRDSVKRSFDLPPVTDENTRSQCYHAAREAIMEITHRRPGPVQLNIRIVDALQGKFIDEQLPNVRPLQRYMAWDDWSEIELQGKKILIVVGEHRPFDEKQRKAIEAFCENYNVVVYVNHLSNYHGKYSIQGNLLVACGGMKKLHPDILITIGGQTGDYPLYGALNGLSDMEHWRVAEDGALVDTYSRLTKVFECPDYFFFNRLAGVHLCGHSYYEKWIQLEEMLNRNIQLPFSNLYVAQQLYKEIPSCSIVNYAILNSLRCWNYFPLDPSIQGYANVAAFGIDGCNSMLIGESMNTDELCFIITGDLAFFYDMNVLGNRHVGNNVRLLLINNGAGVEFKNYNHLGALFGDEADKYIAAAGHYGNKSRNLVRHYAEDLGFEYLSAGNKDEFLQVYESFLTPAYTPKPILFEIFTDTKDESDALKLIRNISKDVKSTIVNTAKQLLGPNIKKVIKGIVK